MIISWYKNIKLIEKVNEYYENHTKLGFNDIMFNFEPRNLDSGI